jgi:excisionase family DNA binding protein
MESDFMTVKDLSAYLNMKEKTIYKLAAEGTLPGFKLGGSWRFRLSEIEAWIKAQSNQGGSS